MAGFINLQNIFSSAFRSQLPKDKQSTPNGAPPNDIKKTDTFTAIAVGIVDPKGKKLGSILFDMDWFFKGGADTSKEIKERVQLGVDYIEKEYKDQYTDKGFADIKKLHDELNNLLKNENPSIDEIEKFLEDIRKSAKEISNNIDELQEKQFIKDKDNKDTKEYTATYKTAWQKYALVSTLERLAEKLKIAEEKKNAIFIDKDGNKLGSILFDIDWFVKDADTSEKIKERTQLGVNYIEKRCKEFSDIEKLHKGLNNFLNKKDISTDEIIKFYEGTRTVSSEIYKKIEELRKDGKEDSPEYKNACQKYDLAMTVDKLNYYFVREHLKASSKKVLSLEDSGTKKYPEKHSFFTFALQETSGYIISDFIADEIGKIKGESIENTILKIEKKLAEANKKDSRLSVPEIGTHRLSEHSTRDKKDIPFEVLFVTGSPYDNEDKTKFTEGEEKLKKAIEKEFGVKTHVLPEQTIEEFEKKIIELSKKISKENKILREERKPEKKLYIIYTGHGSARDIQDGVSEANAKKQGAQKFNFALHAEKRVDLDEDRIKEIYNEHLKGIEVITIFDSCHGGAGITAIESKRFDTVAWFISNIAKSLSENFQSKVRAS